MNEVERSALGAMCTNKVSIPTGSACKKVVRITERTLFSVNEVDLSTLGAMYTMEVSIPTGSALKRSVRITERTLSA